ncbi:MAG TPA: kelch repeat-containing protein [Planctomycetota bacterium]|nr:kelch repeat-containing protein [Planctomycetota bacterium]
MLGGHYDNFDSGASWVFAVPVTVSPSSLPSATLNQPGYSQTITASGGSAPLTLSHTGTFPPGMMFDDATGILNGTPTALGTYTFTVTATDSGGATGSTTYTLPVIQAAPGTFTTVASMTTARAYQTATLLSSGKVLVAGGYNGTYLQSAEVYDSASNTWTAAGSLITARGYHTSTLLPSGKVLVVGGYNSKSGALSSAEVYDPVSNTWSAAGTLATGRDSHTATLLPSGKVLVAGGFNGTSFLNLSSAEVYDPASNTWSAAGTLSDFRSYHTATLLPSGKVLVAGGQGNSGKLSSVDVYDPASSSWSAAGTLSTTRGYHTATLMPSGKVLVAGGQSNSGNLSSAEVYDPAINTWSTTGSLSTARLDHTATLLPNGKVLVAGGFNSGYLSSAEVYDPATNTWSAAGSLNAARHNQTATLLPSGKVLVVGGISTSGLPVSSAELYDSASNTWTATATLTTGRDAHTATLLSSGKVLVAGGFNDNLGDLNNAELFDPTAKVWTATGSFNTPRELHTATLLSNGKVLIAGGTDGNAVLSTAEIYDPASGTWAAAGNVGTRYTHTATLLPSGKVLVTGGIDGNNVLDSAMLYDPGGNSWTPAANLSVPRFYHSATLLPSGRVLVAGGKSNFGIQNTAEIYDPVANTWTATGNLLSVRAYQTATLLPSGKVLIAAGRDASNAVGTAEIFDPGTNTWSSAGSLSAGRYQHTATLLASGRVLIAGGWTGASVTNGAEIYDPATNAWSAAGNLLTPRILHTTTLLTSGQVIVAGGNYGTALSSTELTDDGLQYQSAWRPTIASATSPLTVQTPMSLTGTLFTGISEASGGATNNSPSNNPFVVLQSLANEQVRYLRPDPANPWTASSYSSLPVAPLNPGYALLTVIVNGIPSQSSIIQINNPAGVTPVRLDSFAARTEGTGVLLSWNAISEFQNAGFNVYRRSLSAPQDEPRPQGSGHDWTRVNAALIAGRATNPDSKTYRLYDWAPPGAYQYKLESVSLDGVRESYTELAGPVELDWRETNSRSISDDGDGAAQASIAAEAQERRGQKNSAKFAALAATATARERQDRTQMLATVRAIPYCRAEMPGDGSAAVSSAATQPIATLNANAAARWFSQTSPNRTASFNAVKVVYDTPGVLRVPQSSLPVGFDIRHVSIQREGRSVTALAVTNDSLILFGPGYQDDYTDKDAFFLRAIPGNTAAGRLSSATGLFASAQPVYAESPASVTASYHDVYYDYNYRPYDFPPWFSGQYLTQGTDQTFSIDTPLANGSAASLVVNVWSLTQSETATPDHALQVLVNGQPVGQTQWSGGGKMMQLSFEIAASVLVNGANQIDLVTPALDGVDSQISFLHSMTVNYTRALDTSKPVGVVNASAATKLFELTSASANAWIVDTRYPDRAALVPYESQAQADGTFKLRFTAASGGTGHYLVVPVGQENQPLAVSKRQIKPVPSNNQYLAVGPTQFSAGIQPLLARRSKEGIRTSFVDQEQVFDYYGFGRYGPAAIQAAVRATRPKYLLLLGRTTYDYRNYSGANVDPLCPAFLVSTSNWAQTTSDSMFGDLGRGYPEVAVGRLPVNDTGDLNGAVNHILSYKGIASSNIKVHAVADRTDPSAGDFGALLDSVSSAHPELAWQRNYLGTTSNDPADITAALNTAANGAADVLLYSGHGNALRLGKDDPRILDTEKVQLWTGHTIFLQATCTANWMAKDESDYKSIAIQALTQPQGGISASIASSTYVTADAHVEFMNQLLKNANASGTRWGDALLKTQQWSFQKGTTPGIYGDLGKSEQLFGEPALPVFAPIPAPTLNSQPGKF